MWKAVGLCVLMGTTFALASPTAASLEVALAGRGLRVVRANLRWVDPPGLKARRALALASDGSGLPDVYAVTARTGAGDRVLEIVNVSNLTRSPEAAEEALTADGRWAAFVTRVGTSVTAFTLVDTHGAPETQRPAATDLGARVRAAVTRWQQTGRLDGYGVHRFDLTPRARRVAITLSSDSLRVNADTRAITLSNSTLRVTDGARFVQSRPRLAGTTGWITWMVDTVRAVPWIGAEPIAWAEHIAFGMKNEVARARLRVEGDHAQSDVAEDLADVLNAGASGHTEGRVTDWPPPRIRGLLAPLSREGEWASAAEDDPFVARNPGAPAAFVQSFVRTDRERPDTRVYVSMWDPRQVELHVVPGSQEPIGAGGETGTGTIPRDERTLRRIAAGFNGGFQALHGEWGLRSEGVLFLPPKPWGATIVALEDGSTGFGSWPGNRPDIPDEVVELRQNLTALVEDGVFNPFRRSFWGGNVPSAAPGDEHTTRTGMCLTREGFVGFFWGEDLTPRSLADGMIAARCAYGVHLDMNGANTGFEYLRVTPQNATPALRRALSPGEAEGTVSGGLGFNYRARRMVRGMHEMSFPRYIKRDPRDFFYLLLRPVLPGVALPVPVAPAQQGEGQWHVAGLGDVPFPWPMARTRVRPDPARPDRWVNLVRLDARRLTLTTPDAQGTVVARVLGAPAPPPGSTRLAWVENNGSPRWAMTTEGPGLDGAPLLGGMAITRAVGIDADGFLVYAVADRAAPDLVARALDLAGCGPERLALTSSVIALGSDRDVAGAALTDNAQAAYALVARPMRGGVRMFPEIRPVPPNVWYDAQHRRVRYHVGEGGSVEVNTVTGRITTPMWGSSSRHDAGTVTPPPAP